MRTAPIVLDGADQADAQLAGGALIADNHVFFALGTLSENRVGLGSHTLTSPWGGLWLAIQVSAFVKGRPCH
jgi:hypothetical protein